MEVFWEFQQSAKKWVRYSSAVSYDITTMAKGNDEFELLVDGVKVKFEIDKLRQRNLLTNFLTPIRCGVKNYDDEFVIWEMQMNRRRFDSFLPQIAIQLEQQKHLSITDIPYRGQKATVSFKQNRILLESNAEMTVRRTFSDATPVDITMPVPMSTAQTRANKRARAVTAAPNPPAAGAPSAVAIDADEEVENKKSKLEEVLKKAKAVVVKSTSLTVEVDEFVPDRHLKRVYVEGNDVYSVMLNQTNVSANNNKFFVIQILCDNNRQSGVFYRWGRVGFKGQHKYESCGMLLDVAKQQFTKKFHDKTGNEFPLRHNFVKIKGKYDLIEMDHSKGKDALVQQEKDGEPPPESKLDVRIQEFLNLICDMKMMEEAARKLDYDVTRAPLGKLTKAQIMAGYEALTRIEKCIIASKFDDDFKDAVDEYYTRIPHCFGMRQPSTITTLDELKHELELLEVLTEIEAAVASLTEEVPVKEKEKVNPIDATYKKLKCKIEPLEPDSERQQLIERYLQTTHAPAHDAYSMKVRRVYEVEKHGEKNKFKSGLGNRRLLWHGSRITNWHGILSRGLRIAPKEAPVTGYMFGKGVYFADMSSKSANYCYPTNKSTGILALAEVALGQSNHKYWADYHADGLPSGMSSVMGVGNIGPDPTEFTTIDDGVIVPCGRQIDQPETAKIDNALLFNEYIVYDTAQIKLRYLVEVEFSHKHK